MYQLKENQRQKRFRISIEHNEIRFKIRIINLSIQTTSRLFYYSNYYFYLRKTYRQLNFLKLIALFIDVLNHMIHKILV